MQKLVSLFHKLDGQSFRSLQSLSGAYHFQQFDVTFLRIQGSPGAHPASIAEVSIDPVSYGFAEDHFASAETRFAVSDFLIRRFRAGIQLYAKQNRGQEGSGSFHTIELSQKMIRRDAVFVSNKSIRLRFIVSLPSRSKGGGSFDGKEADLMFQDELEKIVSYTFCFAGYTSEDKQAFTAHLQVIIDRNIIEQFIREHNCICFVPDNALLPRSSGVDDRPMKGRMVKLFNSPDTLNVRIPLPDQGDIRGMAIPEGICVITGGGFHGKSTLMQAIEAGIYPHIPGDGRERIVTRSDAVSIRAEEGRKVEKVDISPFIRDLPTGASTRAFSTDNASGSTSQAASIIESLEMGSRLLLFDEDTCATNFLVRDTLIQKIISPDREPIKPLYHAARFLWEQYGISSCLVVGGLGIFLQKADTILLMADYECSEITSLVRQELGPIQTDENVEFHFPHARKLHQDNFDPSYTNTRLNKKIPCRIKPLRNAPEKLEYGMDLIDLSALPQLVEAPQTAAIGVFILKLRQFLTLEQHRNKSIKELIDMLYYDFEENGLFELESEYPGLLSLPRKYELAASINRFRSLRIAK